MQPNSSAQSRATSAESSNECPNCHAMMPREMRFCRACGYRMGEGIEEYVETVRLSSRTSARARSAGNDPFQSKHWGAMAHNMTQQTMNAVNQATSKLGGLNCVGGKAKGKGRKVHWIVWVILAFLVVSVAGGGLMTPFALRKRSNAANARAQKSYFGVERFRTADGGAFVDFAWPPGGPADKAGIVGGDVVISFDGNPVKGESDIQKILAATPVGKTVDVEFLRDGQPRTTKLTTISRDEFERLDDAFDNRKGKGYIAEGTDIDRVIVPGMNIYGARLNRISRSGPADMAGLKDGDIVIEFDGIPTRTRAELEKRIERAEPYSTVTVVVIRGGERVEIPVKIGIDD